LNGERIGKGKKSQLHDGDELSLVVSSQKHRLASGKNNWLLLCFIFVELPVYKIHLFGKYNEKCTNSQEISKKRKGETISEEEPPLKVIKLHKNDQEKTSSEQGKVNEIKVELNISKSEQNKDVKVVHTQLETKKENADSKLEAQNLEQISSTESSKLTDTKSVEQQKGEKKETKDDSKETKKNKKPCILIYSH